MKTLKMLVELEYDEKAFILECEEERDWFFNMLLGKEDILTLNSNEIGEDIGIIKVKEIIK